ncbi:MAG TPA: class I SAM-dependent methyltransferase [Candidatus Dormibacteraeota bacterium]|nr:class I SAM-dependent methyltransferase [Candidatus Dormibacteraeota bacterium]
MELGLYGLSLRMGYHLLAARRLKRGLRYLVEPVPYWRSLEFRLVWEHGDFRRGDRVLDVGSPKPFSLYLARSAGAIVDATDIEDYFIDEFTFARDAVRVSAERMTLRVEDGRRLSYASGQFDKVYSVSVLEHIPQHGDSECARELGRVLAPGGSCLITVPFWPNSKDVYRKPDFYWSDVSGPAQGELAFFQRRYSAEDLQKRLIEPSGLVAEKVLFVGERVMTNTEAEVGSIMPRVGLGPIHPLMSRALHTAPVSDWRRLKKPLCAFLKLTKPA